MKSTRMVLLQLALLLLFLPAALRPLWEGSQPEIPVAAASSSEAPCTVSVRRGDSTAEMNLEEYVVGVVLAEMPTEFAAEALKAQAVVARTFAWKAATTGGKHGDGSVCTAPACCQGYIAPGEFLQGYGNPQDLEKARSAVWDTAQMVLTYQGNLIEATYFSCASGYTEDAVAVWGSSYPYLTAQRSPEAAKEDCVAFSSACLQDILGVQLGEDAETWFTRWEYTRGMGVASVRIGDKVFSGLQLRRKLGLRSTAFTVSVQNDVIFFHTKGYGHRVGMSQQGADTMAELGSSFEEILAYYYPGTALEKISETDINYEKSTKIN